MCVCVCVCVCVLRQGGEWEGKGLSEKNMIRQMSNV